MKLTLWQRILLRVNSYVFVRYEKRAGWKGYLPIYVFKCKRHGLQESYPHGYDNRLDCLECLEELFG